MLTFNYDQDAFSRVKEKEGYEEGIEIGTEKGIIKSIKDCFQNGIPIKKLSEIFGKPEDEIKRIVE